MVNSYSFKGDTEGGGEMSDIKIDTDEIEQRLIKEATECFDINHIVNKSIEELGELIVALCKGDIENITEEIADVRIMLEQVETALNIDSSDFRKQKMNRLKNIIEKESELLI